MVTPGALVADIGLLTKSRAELPGSAVCLLQASQQAAAAIGAEAHLVSTAEGQGVTSGLHQILNLKALGPTFTHPPAIYNHL